MCNIRKSIESMIELLWITTTIPFCIYHSLFLIKSDVSSLIFFFATHIIYQNTQGWVDAHCCLHLLPIWNFRGFNWTEENVENVFLNYDRPSHGFLLSQRLIANHPQQDDCKSTKKNWLHKILGLFSCIAHLLFLSLPPN